MSDRKKPQDFEGTTVDLGEDLLSGIGTPAKASQVERRLWNPENPGTTTSLGDPEKIEPLPPAEDEMDPGTLAILGSDNDLEDQFQSAVILLNEGLVEDAKHVLHRILISDLHHVPARKKLEEIHDLELKQLFGDGEIAPRGRRSRERKPGYVDSEAVLRELDQDLGLGVLHEGDGDAVLARGLSLFGTRKEMQLFGERIERKYPDMSPRDRIDMGIAFLEMGLYELAVRLFRAVTRRQEQNLEATGLLAQALILAGQAFEATLCMEPLLAITEIRKAEKIHLMYLMARAHEQLGKGAVALGWYEQVRALDAHYRDTQDRVKALKNKTR